MMNWRLKARLQNMIDMLPPGLSYSTYYFIQRHVGGLRRVNPVSGLKIGAEICRRIAQCQRTVNGRTFMEVGTGRRINVPIAFWLAGAGKTITVDLNPYLKEELIREDIAYMRDNREQIRGIFNGQMGDERFARLLERTESKWGLNDLLELCSIDYIAPGNAANVAIPSDSVDYHISHNVFEHIPYDILKEILNEGNRILRTNGLLVHRIDYKDHFSYSDKSISPINFLQFTDAEWERISGNRYMYTNRLRADDFTALFTSANQRILVNEPEVDPGVRALLQQDAFRLNDRFSGKPADTLAITSAWIIVEKCS